jgi:hypothetical protein
VNRFSKANERRLTASAFLYFEKLPTSTEAMGALLQYTISLDVMLCLRSEDAFVITCVANLMEVKVLYVQQDLRFEISSYWRFNV